MVIDLSIPIYAGGYRMDADALQAEMVTLRSIIHEAALTEDERREIINDCHAARRWTFAEIEDALTSRIQELLPARLDWRDRHGWTIRECVERLDALRAEMAREYGVVR